MSFSQEIDKIDLNFKTIEKPFSSMSEEMDELKKSENNPSNPLNSIDQNPSEDVLVSEKNETVNTAISAVKETNIETDIDIENDSFIEDESESDELLEDDPKKTVRILFKKCLGCHYLADWNDTMKDCSEDDECPAKTFKLVYGRDPRTIAKSLADMMKRSSTVDKKEREKLLITIRRRQDSIEIMKIASDLYQEMGTKDEVVL